MTESITEQILHKLGQTAGLYHRLLLVVAPPGGGKTTALQNVRDQTGAPLINISLELSRLMLELTGRERARQSLRLLQDIVKNENSEVVLLDNLEILFDISLEQDPLKLIQNLSRNNIVVAAWNGKIVKNSLIYAEPGHPEYRRCSIQELLIVSPEMNTCDTRSIT